MPETTALVVPVLDERATVDEVAALSAAALAAGVVTRVVVVDGGSTDGTRAALLARGVEVLVAGDVADGPVAGKGDSVWRAAQVVEADRYVLVDGDLQGLTVDDVRRLRDALDAPGVELAKASFDRQQTDGGGSRPLGGRVTELLARPLLARFAPDLAHVLVPLSGQQAVRRNLLRSLPVLTGYGLEMGLLLAVRHHHGAAAVVDVPIGPITHAAKDDRSLVPMAHQVLAAAAWGLGLDAGTTPLDVAASPGAGLQVRPPTLVRA